MEEDVATALDEGELSIATSSRDAARIRRWLMRCVGHDGTTALS
ncbi:hypothetical protein AB5I41_14145 [Sphingomonas sp. MMS24-JH45]